MDRYISILRNANSRLILPGLLLESNLTHVNISSRAWKQLNYRRYVKLPEISRNLQILIKYKHGVG